MSCNWHAKLFNGRGSVLYHLGQYVKALRDYDRSLDINPDDPDTLNNRGMCLMAMTDKEVAEARRQNEGIEAERRPL